MSTFKIGAHISGRIIVATILSFFICISINVICTTHFTENIGYNAYVYTQDGDTPIDEYQYLYTDTDGTGKDDTKKENYEEQGYIVTTYNVRSTLSGSNRVIFLSVTQLLCFILVIAFSGNGVFKQGFKDANLVRTGHLRNDIFRGFKIGLVANLPFFVLFALLIILTIVTPNFRTVWYAFLNSHFYSAILWISGNSDIVSKLSVLQLVFLFLLQFVIPLASGIAYILGFKEINLTDKLIYKRGEI